MTFGADPTLDARFGKAETIFFVVGGQKCGTTWLHKFFSKHPQVCVPGWKETNYWNAVEGGFNHHALNDAFDARYKPLSVRLRTALRSIYKAPSRRDSTIKLCHNAIHDAQFPHNAYADALFDRRNPSTRAYGEVCPKYGLLSPQTYQQMDALGANVRFIYLMRDPVARFLSGVKHGLRGRADPTKPYTDQLNARVAKDMKNAKSWARQMSSYHHNTARIETVIPADRISYVFFENLFEQATIDGLCSFIGVDAVDGEFETKVNADTKPSVDIPQELRVELAHVLTDVYDAMEQKFGRALPAAWRTSMSLTANEEHANG